MMLRLWRAAHQNHDPRDVLSNKKMILFSESNRQQQTTEFSKEQSLKHNRKTAGQQFYNHSGNLYALMEIREYDLQVSTQSPNVKLILMWPLGIILHKIGANLVVSVEAIHFFSYAFYPNDF